MTKRVFLLDEYRRERRKQQVQSLNVKLLDIMDAIVQDYALTIPAHIAKSAIDTNRYDKKGRK